VSHEHKMSATTNTFFFAKNNGPRKPEMFYIKFDCNHLNQARTRTLSVLPGPNSALSVLSGPNPARTLHYLCYQARTRTLSVLPSPNSALSVLPDPDPNIICATRPELCIICANRPGPKHYLCYQARTLHYLCYKARTQTLSVLPGPDSALSVLPGPDRTLSVLPGRAPGPLPGPCRPEQTRARGATQSAVVTRSNAVSFTRNITPDLRLQILC
jgi:hypothetical protein